MFAFLPLKTFSLQRNKQTRTRNKKCNSNIVFVFSLDFSFRAWICLLKICNFWNYYFICIVWSHRVSVGEARYLRSVIARKFSNLTNHFEYFISINIVGECLFIASASSLSVADCLSWYEQLFYLRLNRHLWQFQLLIRKSRGRNLQTKKTRDSTVAEASKCRLKVILLTSDQLRISLLQNKSTKTENWQNKTANAVAASLVDGKK